MSQPEMPLVEVVEREFNAAQKAVRDMETLRWSTFGRGIGQQTDDVRKRALNPDWQWNDWSI